MIKLFTILVDKKRVFGLDILRAIAILCVMHEHGLNFFYRNYREYYKILSYDGVGIFFVLSGFLIGGILINELEKKKIDIKLIFNFWLKRWSRTFPNYYLFLIIAIIIESTIGNTLSWSQIVPYFFFSQNLLSIKYLLFFSHSWSLAVEEWFYLSIPVLLLMFYIITKVNIKWLLLSISVLILLIVPIFRWLYFSQNVHNYESFENIRFSVFYRFDNLMYGLVAAWISYYANAFWEQIKKYLLLIGVICLVIFFGMRPENNSLFRFVFSFSFTSITVFCFIPFLNSIKTTKNKLYYPITYISLISYSLYLINTLVSQLLEHMNWEYLGLSWGIVLTICFVLFWVFSITLSILNYKFFEIPTTTFLRNKFRKSN